MKPGTPPLQSIRLLDQLRERIRYLHYSLSTEQIYVYWVRFFIRWSGREGPMRHPRDIGAPGVEAFLSMLATERKVSASTHNQALSALLFLYREVLAIELPWMDDIKRPAHTKRIPSVLTKDEVAGVGFWGQSPNSPSLRLALRGRYFAPQRNWCLTPITRGGWHGFSARCAVGLTRLFGCLHTTGKLR